MANPPFNVDEVDAEKVKGDKRLPFGLPGVNKLKKDDLGRAERERVKQSSREPLAAITARLSELDRFWEKEQTKAELRVFILDEIFTNLPTPPLTLEEKKAVASDVYDHVWQQAVSGEFVMAA